MLSYNENPDSRSSVNPDNIPLQVHPKVLLYKITHIQCQSWIAFWRTRIVSLLFVNYIHVPVYMYQNNMDATKLHDCTLYLYCYPKNDISFIMMRWFGCFFLHICCHNSSLHADSAGTFVYFYRYLLLFWFFHANDTSVNTFLAIVYLFLLCSLSCW